jgi:hypothetical protein
MIAYIQLSNHKEAAVSVAAAAFYERWGATAEIDTTSRPWLFLGDLGQSTEARVQTNTNTHCCWTHRLCICFM